MGKNKLVGTLIKKNSKFKKINKKNKVTKIIKIGGIFFLLLISLFIIFQDGLTGLTIVSQEEEYSLYEKKQLNNSTSFIFNPEKPGELTSISISGKIKGKGFVKIQIDNLTILDSEKIHSNQSNIQILKKYNNDSNNETKQVEIINNTKNETLQTIEIIFENYCLQTCSIKNLEKESYEIKIKIENSLLNVDEITYKIKDTKRIDKKNIKIIEQEPQTAHKQIKVGENVEWTKNIQTKRNPFETNIPKDATNIKVKKQTIQENNETKESEANYSISLNKKEDFLEITIDDSSEKYTIYYETPSPKKTEKEISNTKKIIIVSAPDSLNYKNIIATTQIKEIAKTKEEIKVYWVEESKEIDFQVNDTNLNGIIDTVIWTVPHLSNQTFEITINDAQSQNSTPTKTGNYFNQWYQPENAYASNNLYTEEDRNSQSQDWQDFNFDIPLTSTIQGIEVSLEGQDPSWAGQGVEIELSGDGGNSYTSPITTTWPSAQDQINIIGNETFLWGRDWIAEELSNENFIIKLTKIGNDWNIIKIDEINVKIFYQENPDPIKITLLSPEKEYASIYIPDFEFQVINEQENTTNCSLLLNSETQNYSFQTIAENSTTTTITPSYLQYENYTWQIECFNENQTFFSKKRKFNYSTISPPESEEGSPSQHGKIFNQWYQPENAYLSNNEYSSEETNFEQQDWYNFNFSIPNNSIINGIELQIEGRDPTYSDQKISVEISGDNATSFTEPTNITLDGIESIKTIGNSTFLWERNWTEENFSNENFMIKLTKLGEQYNAIEVDNIKVILHTQEFLPEPTKIKIYTNSITDVSSGLNEGPSDTNITMKFQITAEQTNDFVNSTPKAQLSKENENIRESNCQKLENEITTKSINYTCTISMKFWDSPGDWKINVSIEDSLGQYYENATENIYVGATSGFITSQSKLNWSNISPGEKNILASNPLILKNTGNTEKNISVLSYDLLGEIDSLKKIPADQFSVSIQPNCNGTIQKNSTEKKIENAILTKGNSFLNDSQGKEELYFCLIQSPSTLTNQNYSTQTNGEWFIKIF